MPDNRKPLIYGAFPVCRNYTVRAHLRNAGTAKRCGHQNRQQYAGSLLRRLHAGHLRPRHHRRAAQSGADDGEHPIPCRLMLSATRSRWGQRLGQKKWQVRYWAQKCGKSPDFERNQDFSGCGGRTRTYGLRVMSPTSYQLLHSAILNLRILVPVTGLEPVQYCYRGILSPLCLPVPPHRQTRY